MNNIVVINQVLILFLIMLIGFIARKREFITATGTQDLTRLLLYVTCPLTIFTSFQFEYSRAMLVGAGQVFAFSITFHLIALLISFPLFFRYPEPVRRVLRFTTIFANCGFMGFPLLQSIYGKSGVFYGSFYVMGFTLFVWTVGIRIFIGKQDGSPWKKVFTNPNLIALCLGLGTFVLPVKLPLPIYSALEIVGAMNTPLSMLLVGVTLTEVKLRELFTGLAVYYGSFVRLLLVPFIALLITNLFSLPPIVQGVSVLLTATPAAALTTAFAAKYNGDTHLSSRLVLLSTIFSIITLPFIVFLLNR
ncbi:MAG: AEC family transporter [Firmicutes bacterium]|nr:AEC family transporter [Bacillota bacterium]